MTAQWSGPPCYITVICPPVAVRASYPVELVPPFLGRHGFGNWPRRRQGFGSRCSGASQFHIIACCEVHAIIGVEAQ